jgi:hypothetical protein
MTAIRTALAAAALASAAAVPASTPVTPVASATPAPGTVAVIPPAPAAEHMVRSTPVRRGMFATPEDAMRYLVTAYNHHDLVSLKHVTTPEARDALEAMRANATDLRLRSCTFRRERGDYECTFSHGFPASAHRTDRGRAVFTVAPAYKPGWYMTVLEECN